MIEKREFGPIPHECPEEFDRADLEVYGINHYKPSYTAMIFLNDPDVTEENADDQRSTFAGRFSVFGHYHCFGGPGHCHVPATARRFDTRPSHPLTKAFKRVDITAALKQAVTQGEELIITIVAHSEEGDDNDAVTTLMDFSGIQLTTF